MENRNKLLSQLRGGGVRILPSMLLCDFGNLEREAGKLREAGVSILHLDIMDGVFVPNFTYGMTIVEAVKRVAGDMIIDCHLMMVSPEKYLKQFRDAGADLITIHAEAVGDFGETAERIRELDVLAGIALNPGTPVNRVARSLCSFDVGLVMTVEPGFGGQAFQERCLSKLTEMKELVPELLLQVDGGISTSTVAQAAAAGAELIVAGSAIFRSGDYSRSIGDLTRLSAGVVSGQS